MTIPQEIIIYIHGVSGDLRGRDHTEDYEALHNGIASRNSAWPTRYAGVEWGWNHDPGAAKSQQLLTDAQRLLGSRLMPALHDQRDFTLNPARAVINKLRDLVFYGFGDMFYYVSQAGKAAVRDAVAQQIIDHIESETDGDDSVPVSLTLLGHSAGSVIAADFLFALFTRAEDYTYVELPQCEVAASESGMVRLRRMAHADSRLRVRRLITFGSPISLLACRSDAVLEILARNKELNPADFGLTSQWSHGEPVEGSRWINLWDRDDPIAWPIEPLIAEHRRTRVAEDVYVDVSDSVSRSHTRYWRSEKAHRSIAERW